MPQAISFSDPSGMSFATPGAYSAYPPEHIGSHPMFLQQTQAHHLHGPPLQSPLDQHTQFQPGMPQHVAPPGYAVVREHDAVPSTSTSYQPQAIASASEFANFDSQTQLAPSEIAAAWQRPEELYWHSDDEASMVASDEEEDDDDDTFDPERDETNLESNHMGIMVARRVKGTTAHAAYGTQLRTPASCLGSDDMLASYHPAAHMSPLNDEQVALVFWHFVNVTARAMSLYERHPLDASPMFQGRPVPKSRQHIWTCMLLPILQSLSGRRTGLDSVEIVCSFILTCLDRYLPHHCLPSSRTSPGYVGPGKSPNGHIAKRTDDGFHETLSFEPAKDSQELSKSQQKNLTSYLGSNATARVL